MRRRRSETRARARALQALYAWDVRAKAPLDVVATRMWDDLCVPPDERLRAARIIRTVMEQHHAIDDLLRDVTSNWRLERVGAIERSVMRLAAAELLCDEEPPRVVLQEAVILAERFGSAQSARFVNGVIDAVARRLGRL
ncbi:MAG TPA: transcription antitermination factor NusB [Gemmatimonadaceae bacterium]|nr:transcription antitermination factor NusB [Gemmatimonadaceae bacterium]